MADLTYDIQVNKDQAQRNLDQLQKSVGKLNDAFGLLKAAIGSIALGNIIAQANQFADSISDLSDATGVAIDNILGFTTAVAESGGNADTAQKAILRLVGSIGGAADGSLELQNAFRAVGVTLNDLRTLSEQDILKKTIKGLGDVTDKAEQSTLKTKLLGKEFRGIAVEDLAGKFSAATTNSSQYTSSIKAAADAQQNLEGNMRTFQLTLLKILEPLNKLISAIQITGDAFTVLIASLGAASIAFGAFMVATAPVSAFLLLIAGSAALLGSVWSKLSEQIDKMKGITAPPPPVSDEDVAKAEAEAKALREVTDALEKRRKEISKASEAFKRQNNDILDNINLEKSFIGKTEDYIEVEKAREAIIKRAADESAKLRDAKSLLTKEEQGLAATYDAQIAKISKAASVDADRVANGIVGLQGLRLIESARKQDVENTTKAIEAQISRQQQFGDIVRAINDQKVDIKFEQGLKGLTPLQQEIAKIQESARKAALEAGRSFSAAFDNEDGLTPDRAKELADGLEQIAQGYRDIAQAQIDAVVNVNPLMDSWNEYKNNALDSANQIKSGFQNTVGGLEDAFVRFVQTGKLSFKDLANSILADLAKIAFKKAVVGLGSLFGFAAGGQVMADTPIMVGERGPELFVPRSAGTIVPHNALSNAASSSGSGQTMVTYNIQAVDAASFRSLVARDPSFIYAVTEQGRRSQPTRSR